MFVGDFGNCRDVWYAVLWIADRFDIDRASILIDGFVKLSRVITHHPLYLNLKLLQVDAELIETATVYCPEDAEDGLAPPCGVRFRKWTYANSC